MRRATTLVTRHVDAVLAVGLAAFVLIESSTPGRFPAPVWANVALAMCAALPLMLRRRRPLAVLTVVLAVSLGYAFVWSLPQSAGGLLVVLLAAYSVPRHATSRAQPAGGLLLAVAAPLIEWRDPTTHSPGEAFPTFLLLAAAWVAGVAARRSSERNRQLAELAEQLRHQQEEMARLAVVGERLHIARELHDVLAHSVSVMVVQVGAARLAAGELAAPADEALRSAEQVGRQSLADLRRLLTVLRDDPDQLLLPQPGLSALPELVAASSTDVALHIDPAMPELAAGLDLVVYRIVQEGLTNIVKHAHGARATVGIRHVDGWLEITVDNDPPPSALHPVSRGIAGAGQGVVGMAERAALFGGSVSAGPRPDRGFRVYARVPVTGSAAHDAAAAS